MGVCSVFDCKINSFNSKYLSKVISFHAFPKENKILKQWIKFCRRKDKFNPKTSKVCSRHFTKEDFANLTACKLGFSKMLTLNKGSVPTIYASELETDEIEKNKRAKRMHAKKQPEDFTAEILNEKVFMKAEDPDAEDLTIEYPFVQTCKKELIEEQDYTDSNIEDASTESPIDESDYIDTNMEDIAAENPIEVETRNKKNESQDELNLQQLEVEQHFDKEINSQHKHDLESLAKEMNSHHQTEMDRLTKNMSAQHKIEMEELAEMMNTHYKLELENLALKMSSRNSLELKKLAIGINAQHKLDMQNLAEENMEMKDKIFNLKRENFIMKEAELVVKHQVQSLELRISKSEYERNNIEAKLTEIFTPGQIKKLKNGIKRIVWTDEDIAKSVTLYNTSAGAYKLLKRKKFPLPGIRTLQRWERRKNMLLRSSK